MNINRDKHNKYVAGWTPNITTSTGSETSSGSTSTIIYVGGGGSSSGGDSGTVTQQNTFLYYIMSDGTNSITQTATIPTDTAILTLIGKNGVTVTASQEKSIPETEFVSTGTNTGTYKISYNKLVTTSDPTEEVPEPQPVTTYPVTITYVSGDKILTSSFDTLTLYNTVDETEQVVATYNQTQLQIDGDTTGINSIVADANNTVFSRITLSITVEEQTTIVLDFAVTVNQQDILYVEGTQTEQYWKLDDDGNLYTTYNAYSTQELSAYGIGESEGTPTTGAEYLYQLKDVSDAVQTPIDKGILQYNAATSQWEVTDGSNITPDLTGYAKEDWVTQQITNQINILKGNAPENMDTLGEIAGVISSLSDRVTSLEVLLEWFEWDDANDAIKALFDLYGVGEISAYGYNTQEQPVGAQYLNDLLDVTISNPTNNQILIYNGSQWVNQVLPESGLNESELAQYLTEHNYVQSSALEQYATITQLNQEITNLIGGAPAELDTLGEIATVIQSLQQLLDWFSFVDGKIRANYDLWGVGEISAYGVGEGSSSGGKNYLRELEDVLLGDDLASGQLLQYNGTYWVNIDKDEVGLNETELANYLTQNNYLQQGDVTWSNLSGKPSTFNTTINQINDLNSSWDSLLLNPPTDYVTRWPAFSEVTDKPTTLAGYGITDAYTKTETDNRYVNITGDTMTGNLTLPALIANDYIRIGSTARLEYDSTNNAIKVTNASGGTVNFYATGEVSAYGAGSGSTIRGYLNDLQDVTINGATTGQALIYNGSQWVNQTIQQGLDEDALEDYLNNNGYLPSDAAVNQGTAGKLAYYSGASTIDDYISTVGSNTKFMYLNAGVPTASNGTVGNTLTPVYLNAGTFTTSDKYRVRGLSGVYTGAGGIEYPSYFTDYGLAVNMMDLPVQYSDVIYINGYNNGGADVPYINAIAFQKTANAHGEVYHARGDYGGDSWGTWYKFVDSYNYTSIITKLGTSTVGSGTKLWYLNAGTPTNSTSTIGSNYIPVFLSSGTITASSQEFMVNRGVLSDYWTNWNSALTAGMYSLSEWGTNGPSNAGYSFGTVAIFQSGSSSYGGAVSQLYMPHSNAEAGVYAAWRTTYQESSSRWTNWHYLLDTGNYANFLNNYYVRKTGDTMTGTLYIENSGAFNTLRVTRSDSSTQPSSIVYANSGGVLGYIGVSAYTTFSKNKYYPIFSSSSSAHYILHNSRDYVGMMADSVDLRSYSTSNFYPYVFDIDRGYNQDIEVYISSSGGLSSAAYNANHIHFFMRNGGWSDNGYTLTILDYHTYLNNEITIGCIGRGSQNGTFAIWLRGGISYNVYHTSTTGQSIHTSSYSTGGATYTVGTNMYGGSNTNVTIAFTPPGNNYNTSQRYFLGGSMFTQSVFPNVTNMYQCGGESNRWSNVYSTNGDFSSYLQIGSCRLRWNSTSNALYIEKSDGTSANFYATGEVSAYGMGSGGPANVDSLTFTPGAGNHNLYLTANGIRIITASSSGWGAGITVYNNANTTKLGEVCGAYGGQNAFSYSYFGGPYNSPGMTILANKNVGIGTTNPTYKLHVSGTAYATGGFQNGSDIRYKDVIQDIFLSVTDIANAPSFTFSWKNDQTKQVQCGTSAQYWQKILPQVIMSTNNQLSMSYDKAALISVISVAKEVETLEQRVSELERENAMLKQRLSGNNKIRTN